MTEEEYFALGLGNDEELLNVRLPKPEPEEGIDIHGQPVILVGAPRVWLTTENESPIYLTREDILELGFLRSNPERKIWQHKDKPTLFYEEVFDRDYGVKDFIVCRVTVFYYVTYPSSIDKYRSILYTSKQPNKEDIQQVIDNYAR